MSSRRGLFMWIDIAARLGQLCFTGEVCSTCPLKWCFLYGMSTICKIYTTSGFGTMYVYWVGIKYLNKRTTTFVYEINSGNMVGSEMCLMNSCIHIDLMQSV